MTLRLVAGLALSSLMLALPPHAGAEDAPAVTTPPPQPSQGSGSAEKLTGLAAWDRLKGNTIEGKAGSGTFAEFFDPAGGVRYVDKDGLSTGTWAVQKDKVCFDFPEDDDRSCSTFEVTGDAGTATDDDGSLVRFRIVQGNSKSL